MKEAPPPTRPTSPGPLPKRRPRLASDDRDIIVRAREAGAELRRRPGDLDRLAGALLAELADRLDGHAAAQGTRTVETRRATCPSCGRTISGRLTASGKLKLWAHKRTRAGTRESGWGEGDACPASGKTVEAPR